MISLILVLALVGLIVWLVTTYIPMPQAIKNMIIIIVVVLMVLYLIQIFAVDIPVPRLRTH